jgi:hypothetical protein
MRKFSLKVQAYRKRKKNAIAQYAFFLTAFRLKNATGPKGL